MAQTVERSKTYGVRIKDGAKSKTSARQIEIGATLVELLRAVRNEQRELALKLGTTYARDCLVFPRAIVRPRGRQPIDGLAPKDVDFGRPWDPTTISKEFTVIARRAGFPGLTGC